MARTNDMPYRGTIGTPGGSYANVTEYGDKYQRVTVIDFQTTLPAIAGGASLAVGKLLYTLPAGACVIDASRLRVAIKQTEGNITADTPDVGLGTTIASGAVAVLGGTAAFENILTGQTMSDCNGTATDAAVGTQLVIAANGNHTVYLNVADGWASDGDAAAIVYGKAIIHWRYLGD